MAIFNICKNCKREMIDYQCSNCLQEEITRLKRGEFTPEELQNLCHNLPEENKEEFFKGCNNYQSKLFNSNAVDEEMERCIKIVENFSTWIGKINAAKIVHSIRQK